MREKRSFDTILDGFSPNAPKREPLRTGQCITTWMYPEYKAKYDKLQEASKGTDRRFSDVVRKTLEALIDEALARAS